VSRNPKAVLAASQRFPSYPRSRPSVPFRASRVVTPVPSQMPTGNFCPKFTFHVSRFTPMSSPNCTFSAPFLRCFQRRYLLLLAPQPLAISMPKIAQFPVDIACRADSPSRPVRHTCTGGAPRSTLSTLNALRVLPPVRHQSGIGAPPPLCVVAPTTAGSGLAPISVHQRLKQFLSGFATVPPLSRDMSRVRPHERPVIIGLSRCPGSSRGYASTPHTWHRVCRAPAFLTSAPAPGRCAARRALCPVSPASGRGWDRRCCRSRPGASDAPGRLP